MVNMYDYMASDSIQHCLCFKMCSSITILNLLMHYKQAIVIGTRERERERERDDVINDRKAQ